MTKAIENLDLQPLYDSYRGTGSRPYRPELMLAIALFEILNQVSSPAKWCRDAKTRDQCKFLGNGIAPSRSVWYSFRDRCSKFIEQLHSDMVSRACLQRAVDPSQCCLDGTLTRASASRHRCYNLKRLNRRLGTLRKAIAYLDSANQDHRAYPLPGWIASTPRGRQQQLARCRAGKRRLLDQIAQNRERPRKYRRNEEAMVISLTDPDAVFGKDKQKVYAANYNTQYMVACDSDMIVSYGIYAQTNDSGLLAPMIEKTQRIINGRLKTVHADRGYCSLLELLDCRRLNVELFAPVQDHASCNANRSSHGTPLFTQKDFDFSREGESCRCPAGHPMPRRSRGRKPRADGRFVFEVRFEQSADRCSQCSLASGCLQPNSKRRTVTRLDGQDHLDQQQAKMETQRGKQSMALRARTVERVFGDGKRHRNQQEQNGRGLERVRAEVGLLVVAQNSLRLYNLEKKRRNNVP